MTDHSQTPPPEAIALYRQYLKDDPLSAEKLTFQLDEYVEFVERVAKVNPIVDSALAFRISEVLRELVGVCPPDKLKFVQSAIRYFIEDEDAEGDLVSPGGFDDDILVVNSVARHIGHPELQFVEN